MIFTEKNICPECSTPNEPEYKYCKNCGSRIVDLKEQETNADNGDVAKVPQHPQTPPAPYEQYVQRQSNSTIPNYWAGANTGNPPPSSGSNHEPEVDSIDGVPLSDIEAYLGGNAGSFITKFIRMEKTGKKTSWCLIPSLLGFILGMSGAAIWFFRQKMYKIALILLAASIVFTTSALLICGNVLGEVESELNALNEKYLSEDIETQEFLYSVYEIVADSISWKYIVTLFVTNSVSNVAALLCGLYGDYAYKNHVVKRIKRYKMRNVDPRYYQLGLSSIGAPSGGMMAVGIIGVVVVNLIAQMLPEFL